MKSLTVSTALLNSMSKVPSTDATNTQLLQDLWNDSVKTICSIRSGKWWFLQTTTDIATVAGQQGYAIPAGIRKIIDVYVTVGTTVYTPEPVYSPEAWNGVLSAQLGESDVPRFYFVQDNKILIAPTPNANNLAYDAQTGDFTVGSVLTGGTSGATATISGDVDNGTTGTLTLASVVGVFQDNETITDAVTGSATTNGVVGNTITVRGRKGVLDLTVDDDTVTVSAIANGATTVTVSSGALVSMAGKYLRIAAPADGAANKGDGHWYEIASATVGTTIELVAPYEGTTITGGSATATVAQMTPIPSAYDMAPIYRTLALFFQINDPTNSRLYNAYWKLYDGGQEAGLSTLVGGLIGQMLESEGESIEGAYVAPTDRHINNYYYEPRQDASGF